MSGRLVVRASRVGADTLLAQITRLVTQAQASKANAQRLADRIAAVFVPCVISLAAVTLGFWLGAGLPARRGLERRSRRARGRLPVRARPGHPDRAGGRRRPRRRTRRPGQERAARWNQSGRIRIVVLDKTGTLTTGAMTATSRHHRCRAGMRTRRRRCCWPARSKTPRSTRSARRSPGRPPRGSAPLPPVTGFAALPGAGVRGRVGDQDVTVGSPGLFAELRIEVPAELREAVGTAARQRAAPRSWSAGTGRRAPRWHRRRAEAGRGRRRRAAARAWPAPVLLTGDNERTAMAVAAAVGIADGRRVRRSAARRQGRRHQATSGRRQPGRVRRRRGQRRGRPCAGGPRHGDRNGHRRRDRRRRPDPGRRRPGRHRRCDRAGPRHDDGDPG